MQVITIAGFKGGIGKTTSAIHIGSLLAAHGPTVVVDADRRNESALLWASKKKLKVDVIPNREAMRLANSYAFVLPDVGASTEPQFFDDLTSGADLVIIPVVPDDLAIAGLQNTLSGFTRTLDLRKVKILLTGVPRGNAGRDLRELLDQGELPMFTRGIRHSTLFKQAVNRGVTVDHIRGGLPVWSDYEAVTEEILAWLHQTDSQG